MIREKFHKVKLNNIEYIVNIYEIFGKVLLNKKIIRYLFYPEQDFGHENIVT